MQDQFNNEIKIGDRVLFLNQDARAIPIDYQYGTVLGFTTKFVIIKPEHPDKMFWGLFNKEKIYRSDYKLIVDKSSKWKDNWMYLIADFENYKKKSLQLANETAQKNVNNVLLDILEIVDDLDRAIDNTNDKDDRDGLYVIYDKFVRRLGKYGVEQMKTNPQNEGIGKDIEFDPEFHEAISTLDMGPNMKGKIVDTIQTGYMIGSKVLRHAKVIVGC